MRRQRDLPGHVPIDRDSLTEILVRLQLSTLIITGNAQWKNIWNQLPDSLEQWLISLAGRKR